MSDMMALCCGGVRERVHKERASLWLTTTMDECSKRAPLALPFLQLKAVYIVSILKLAPHRPPVCFNRAAGLV